MGTEGQSLTAEDQLFILMQAGQHLTAMRGMAAPEVGICYERAESLAKSLNCPTTLQLALGGQWRHSLMADRLSATLQIAKRLCTLAQEQNDTLLLIGAYGALACTLYCLGDIETSGQYAMLGLQLWRSLGARSPVVELDADAVTLLCCEAQFELQIGEIGTSQAAMAEAISLAKELNDTHGLASALGWAAHLGSVERNLAQVERFSSDLIELATRHHFTQWMTIGAIYRGWARSASGDTAVGIPGIEQGIRDLRATGTVLSLPYYLALKAEALYLVDRTSEALETINEGEILAVRFEQRLVFSRLHRLRGVFLAALGAEETQIEASFCEAIRIAREQKSILLAKCAEGTYAEYRRQKAGASQGRGFRLPLW